MTRQATRQATIDENERLCRAAYVEGVLDVAGLEAALDHAWAGGMGCAEYPFLPVFEPLETELVWA